MTSFVKIKIRGREIYINPDQVVSIEQSEDGYSWISINMVDQTKYVIGQGDMTKQELDYAIGLITNTYKYINESNTSIG